MTPFSDMPRLIKGGLVLIDPETAAVKRIIVLQYNADSLSRTFQVRAVEEGGDNRSAPLRLSGPPIETIGLEAEIDLVDESAAIEQDSSIAKHGIHPQLAALETIVYPASSQIESNNQLAKAGTLEIAPLEAPLCLFIWSQKRILPVRITELSVTEEAFDSTLNPIRAKVSLKLRVLSVDDLGFDHKGGSLFMNYHRLKEKLAGLGPSGDLSSFGIKEIP